MVLIYGGAGGRLWGHVDDIPNRMVTTEPLPILWHLMKYHAQFAY
jgi:hypothetical protein